MHRRENNPNQEKISKFHCFFTLVIVYKAGRENRLNREVNYYLIWYLNFRVLEMFNNLGIIYVESARSPVILIKIILNSTEWEITLHLYEFADSWMRYGKGKRSTRIILNLLLQNYILISRKI